MEAGTGRRRGWRRGQPGPQAPTAALPPAVATTVLLASLLVPAVLWAAAGSFLLHLVVLIGLLVLHDRLATREAAAHPGRAVVEPPLGMGPKGYWPDVALSVGVPAAVVATILLLDSGLDVDLVNLVGPLGFLPAVLVLVRELRRRWLLQSAT